MCQLALANRTGIVKQRSCPRQRFASRDARPHLSFNTWPHVLSESNVGTGYAANKHVSFGRLWVRPR